MPKMPLLPNMKRLLVRAGEAPIRQGFFGWGFDTRQALRALVFASCIEIGLDWQTGRPVAFITEKGRARLAELDGRRYSALESAQTAKARP